MSGGGDGRDAQPALELARDPRAARSPAANNAGGSDAALPVDAETNPEPQMPAHTRTVPVIYKNPDGGIGRFILWGLAACGLAGLVWVSSQALARKPATAPATSATAPAAPPAPVQWKAIAKGSDVLVRIEVGPREARGRTRLLLDGAPLASNPVLLPKGSEHTIAATADGYEPASVTVTADAEKSVAIDLRRAAKR